MKNCKSVKVVQISQNPTKYWILGEATQHLYIVLNGLAHNCTQTGQDITNAKILVKLILDTIEYTGYC